MKGKKKVPSTQKVVQPRQVYEDDYTRGEANDRAQSTGMAGYGSGVIKTTTKEIPGAPPQVAEPKTHP